jgi:hypothetical protein
MTQANPEIGVSVVEEGNSLDITCKGGSGVGFALIGSAAMFIVPIIGYFLTRPIGASDISFLYVFGPVLTLVLFLGIRILINSATITANKTELIVKIRPLPLWSDKRVSAADLQSLAVETKRDRPGSRHVTYSLVAHHRNASTTRLVKMRGQVYKDSVHFVKEKLEKWFGL